MRDSSPWKTCPISWKNVTTSSCRMSAGFAGVGFARFATIAVSGYERDPSALSYPGRSGQTAAWEYFDAAIANENERDAR